VKTIFEHLLPGKALYLPEVKTLSATGAGLMSYNSTRAVF
jgi:hypothetical protein